MPISILGNEIFTKQLTNTSLVITEDMGVGSISVYATTGTGTILGTGVLAGEASAAIDVAEGNSITISVLQKTIGPLTITAPSGVTLIIIANQA